MSEYITPERRLWGASLALLIADACFYMESSKAKEPHHKEAFDDLCFCGAITKRLCEKTDTDPAWLSERFRCYARKNLNKED
ncbi:hypothetical protein [Alteromonas sp. R78001]|uniref:hypothetical protein n=1 Tax=Alteromonas sp. R78001 TaxID=3093865 RepID=UPI003670E578